MNDSKSKGDLDQKRIQAKELLKSVRAGDPEALRRALAYFPDVTDFKLANAQLVIARENGYPSWPVLQENLHKVKQGYYAHEIYDAVTAMDTEKVRELVAINTQNALGVTHKTESGDWESALDVAVRNRSLDIARILMEAVDQIYHPHREFPLVFNFVTDGDVEMAEFLIDEATKRDKGAPPTYGCGIDIVSAARIGRLDRVKMHIDRDPLAIYRRGFNGETVLHWPAQKGNVEVVEALIALGAVVDADEIALHGGKPLHWAAKHAPATVRVLFDHGADPNSRNLMKGDAEGFTPLHTCAADDAQCVECAELLLAAGADVHAVSAKGETALEVANRNGRSRMAEYLEKRG